MLFFPLWSSWAKSVKKDNHRIDVNIETMYIAVPVCVYMEIIKVSHRT